MLQEQPNNRIETLVEKAAQEGCEKIFKSKKPEEWKDEMIERLSKYDFVTDQDIARAEEILEDIESVKDIDTFTEIALQALRPVVDYVKSNPKEYQRGLHQDALSDPDKEQINDLLYFHLDKGGDMHLHVLPNVFTSDKEKLKLLREGLSLTAKTIRDNENIKSIRATSWIVAESPKLMEMLGFTVHGRIPLSQRSKGEFKHEDREVWSASISRDDFINKHLKHE